MKVNSKEIFIRFIVNIDVGIPGSRLKMIEYNTNFLEMTLRVKTTSPGRHCSPYDAVASLQRTNAEKHSALSRGGKAKSQLYAEDLKESVFEICVAILAPVWCTLILSYFHSGWRVVCPTLLNVCGQQTGNLQIIHNNCGSEWSNCEI